MTETTSTESTSTPPPVDQLHLGNGAHDSRESGVCLMEAVAWYAGEPHSDHPACVSPYLRRFGIRLNDRASDERRQQLRRFIFDVVGTAGDGLDERRRWMAVDHVVHVSVPRWLDAAGMTEQAEQLRALPPINNDSDYQPAQAALLAVRELTWPIRRDRRKAMRAKVRDAVLAQLKVDASSSIDQIAADAAAAAADDAADDAAAADADAAAAAADDAADDAAAADAADAAAAAADAADAAADAADAAAAAADDAADDAAADLSSAQSWDSIYWAVRNRLEPIYRAKLGPLVDESWDDAFALYERLIRPDAAVSA